MSDAVSYDMARDRVATATTMLLELVDDGAMQLSTALTEARELRLELVNLDGFDRAAVDSFIERLDQRIASVAGPSL
ncbi:MAG: hypothetical protein ACTHNQ_19445 [Microbacterium sp.]|uniref:hypothetical protein n=1 Tax=Microbacterium sp. TaxID=51671 RepID=UPI003F817A2E